MTVQTVLAPFRNTTSWQAESPHGESIPGLLKDAREVDVRVAVHLIEAIPDLVVLDVRTPVEFSEGRIRQSLNLDFYADDFEHALARLDRQASYLVYCRCGGRSTYTLDMMDALGFEQAIHMPAGIEGWRAAGLPVVAV
jgi:phage shock protein E